MLGSHSALFWTEDAGFQGEHQIDSQAGAHDFSNVSGFQIIISDQTSTFPSLYYKSFKTLSKVREASPQV